KMIELEAIGIAEQGLQVRRRIIAPALEADEMLVALAVRQLNEAQPVAAGDQAHGFGVDGDWTVGERHAGRQVFLVEMNSHFYSCAGLPTALVRGLPVMPAPKIPGAGFNHWSQ